MNIVLRKANSRNVGSCYTDGHNYDDDPYPVMVVTVQASGSGGYEMRFCEDHWRQAAVAFIAAGATTWKDV